MSDGTSAARPWRAPDVGPSAAGDTAATAADVRVPLVTAVRIAEIEEQARDEGYRRGLEEGRRDGAEEMHTAAQALARLLAAIEPQAALLDDVLTGQLADLVVAIGRQFVRRELKREPGEIVRVVREALAALPVSAAAIRVLVHPEDAALLRSLLPADAFERPLRLIDDVAMTRGGARIETDVSSVDASVEARLSAIAARVFGDEREIRTAAGVEPGADTEAEIEPGVGPKRGAEIEPKAEIEPETEIEPGTGIESRTEIEPRTEIGPRTEIERREEIEPWAEMEVGVEAEPAAATEPAARYAETGS